MESAGPKQKSLILIRAREVATNLAIPIVLLDPEGTVVFYNHSADALFGRPFSESGELPSVEWAATFRPEDESGEPIAMQDLPAGVALTKQRPHHRAIFYTDTEGVRREIEVTAFPLMGREGELYGAVTIVWGH